ncbi:SDR family oxidoreductase [Candidatus Pelagibacter sp.]|nr:SDR family oxidoreductase [Candidatus Pelagibacter sp.]
MKKICLIGGSGVLGKHFVKELSLKNELHVADVGLRNSKKTKNFFTYYLNLNDEKSVEEFFLKNKKKPFDILINNSAFTTEMAAKIKTEKDIFSSEIFEKTVNINLKGTFLCCKNFIKYHHRKNIDQRVINVSTMYALHGPHHDIYKNENFFSSISYSASKAGIVGMTKWLATKYAIENTNFNTISPSGVFNNQNKKFLKKYSELIPKKKMATQEQVFSVIKFLISKNADYVVGQDIFVDGGFSAW